MTGGLAGYTSHISKTDEWLTPPGLLAALGDFDLDPCAPIIRPWSMAAHHYTVNDNGLLRPWFGRVWLNPPYGRVLAKWMGRMADHGRGTALIFARTDTECFFKFIWPVASAVMFLKGRLDFHYVDGRVAPRDGGAPSVLIAYGAHDAQILGDCGVDGKFIPLRLPRLIAVAMLAELPSWRELIASVLRGRGPVGTDNVYRAIAAHPKTASNPHWKDKVRQVLQGADFERVDRGTYRLAEAAHG